VAFALPIAMNVGIELAEARQGLGLSLEDISIRTKVSIERLSAIECGDLDQLPPLVYLNGFLHAYAAEVHLDGDDVTRRYLAELEQASLHAASEVELVREFDPEPDPPEPAPARASTAVAARHDPDVIRPEEYEARDIAPVLFAAYPPTSAPPRRRYGAVLAVLAVGAVAGVLLSANFDLLTRQFGAPSESSATAGSDATATEGSDPVVPASQKPVPLPAPPEAVPQSEPAPASAADTAKATAAADVERVPAQGDPPPETRATGTDQPTKRASDANVNAGGAEDLSGLWTLTNRVESTSDEAFDKLNLGYRLRLVQRGNRVTGTGQKWMENGKPLPASRRTPITVEGTRTGGRLELIFTEKGAARVSGGTFVMKITADGTLQGTFMGDAANAQGSTLARRTRSPRE
jgi:transcriptional regulator with XRE-family HTH domain